METQQITITNIITSGSGFGVTPDGISAFIPERVIQASGADIGQVFSAHLIQNDLNRSGRTPLLAVRLDRNGTEATEVAEAPKKRATKAPSRRCEDARQKVLDMLDGHMMTSAEIGDALNTDAVGAGSFLHGMWEKGDIAKAVVYANGSQKRASFVMWALNADDFFGENIDG